MLTEHVLERAAAAGLPAEWQPFLWQVLKSPGATEPDAYLVEGGIAPVRTRGKRKGQRDWRRLDPLSRYKFYINPAEHQQWLARYEASTGRCFNCAGEGTEFASWSVTEGTKNRPCSRCNGTGAAPGAQP